MAKDVSKAFEGKRIPAERTWAAVGEIIQKDWGIDQAVFHRYEGVFARLAGPSSICRCC
jgi:hypothetical protein